MKTVSQKNIIAIAGLIIALLASLGFISLSTSDVITVTPGKYKVMKVVDGDTLHVTNGTEEVKVRLIGINTPETVDPRRPVECFGNEASNRAQTLLMNEEVTLRFDETQERVDKYGRTLAYVFLEDGRNFNQIMIEEGYAYEYTYEEPYLYQQDFKNSQHNAEVNKRGLWAPGVCEN